MNILTTATLYWNVGLNTLPIRTDASKAPAVEKWESFHTYQQQANDLDALFYDREVGIAIICGAVSGGLEVIDFDIPEAFEEWRELVDKDLYSSLTIVKSPRGFHVYIRSDFCEGNKKLASAIIDGKKKTKIETRGKGGYVLAPGCPASCHETGLTYELVSGSFSRIPKLTEEQRTLLIDYARSLNEVADHKSAPEAPRTSSGDRPGDLFEARATWDEILLPHGWTVVRSLGHVTYWCRPGKSRGISATTGTEKCGGKLFIFSSNADPFEDGRAYSKFAAYVALEHKGDASAAAKALRARGYKTERPMHVVPSPPSKMDAPPFDDAPPPDDRDAPPIADSSIPSKVLTSSITADQLDELLSDDKGAALLPETFSRLMDVRSSNDAEWQRMEIVLRRHKVIRSFTQKAAKKTEEAQAKRDGSWRDQLTYRTSKSGASVLANTVTNKALILENDPAWRGVLGYDEFSKKIVVRGKTPYTRKASDQWSDRDALEVLCWFEKNYGISPGKESICDAVQLVTERNSFNPLTNYLDSLEDGGGQSSLDTWLIDFFGCADTPLNRAIGIKWMISAVARAYKPGCKVDTVLILEGKQGLRKSRVLSQLCPDPEWFRDGLSDFGSKAQAEEVEGKWIVELGELKGFGKEQEQIKAFVTRQIESYRPAYGRYLRHSPRTCVFAGTVNAGGVGYFNDETGNRRYWPVTCVRVAQDLTPAMRDRLWSEAKTRYLAGEIWWFEPGEMAEAAAEEQSKRVVQDAWHDDVLNFVTGRESVTTSECLHNLGVDTGRRTNIDMRRIGRILMMANWEKRQSRLPDGRRQWRYYPPGIQTNLELAS